MLAVAGSHSEMRLIYTYFSSANQKLSLQKIAGNTKRIHNFFSLNLFFFPKLLLNEVGRRKDMQRLTPWCMHAMHAWGHAQHALIHCLVTFVF